MQNAKCKMQNEGRFAFCILHFAFCIFPMFQRILVANRGEIALRVIRACHDLGIEVVAVYSEADRGAPYLALADEAICIGPANAAERYLNVPRLIIAAEITDGQAIYPGYEILSGRPPL